MAGCQLMFNPQLRDGPLPEAYNGRRITKTTNVRLGHKADVPSASELVRYQKISALRA